MIPYIIISVICIVVCVMTGLANMLIPVMKYKLPVSAKIKICVIEIAEMTLFSLLFVGVAATPYGVRHYLESSILLELTAFIIALSACIHVVLRWGNEIEVRLRPLETKEC